MKFAACLLLCGMLAIAVVAMIVDDTLRSESYILQLSVVAPRGSSLSGWLYDTGRGVSLPSPSYPPYHDDRPAFVHPVPLPSSPAAENVTGVVAVLHSWSTSEPEQNDDRLLAVPTSGAPRRLSFVTVPSAEANTTGATMDWQSFVLSDGLPDVRSPPATDHHSESRSPQTPPPLLANTLTYAGQPGQPGRWVALPRDERSYALAWYDGVSPMIDSYVPVDIVYDVIKIGQTRQDEHRL